MSLNLRQEDGTHIFIWALVDGRGFPTIICRIDYLI